jgi:predicted nucleic acid-binding protein
MVTAISEYLWSMARRSIGKRTPILGSYNLQAAAIALANNLILVTHNTRELERVEGLKLEDWQE